MSRILQIGLGGFGRLHLQAWLEMGFRDQLWVAELSAERRAWAIERGVPPEHVLADFRAGLDQVDAVDIVTATDTHTPLCRAALEAGRDVFIEKPMTPTSEDARQLCELAERQGRLIQVGYYYRVHPIARWIREQVRAGALGTLRYVTGRFLGFKRARTDVGVTHTDAIHFLDLITWLLGAEPADVFAVTRDHFDRGLEDLSIVLLTYPGQVLAQIESGYIQPGRWNDRVVPNAKTSKELVLCGSQATIEADFETGTVELHRVRHELRDGVWQLANEGSARPALPAIGPVEQVKLELQAFLDCVRTRVVPEANAVDSGLRLAELMEAVYQSATQRRIVILPSLERATA